MSHEFVLDDSLSATEPPEAHGVPRDGVRLMVATPGAIRHTVFGSFADHLRPGDLVVVNTSATLAAAVDGRGPDGRHLTAHFSTALTEVAGRVEHWLVELRPVSGATGPLTDVVDGEVVVLDGGARLTPLAPGPAAAGTPIRLWRARIDVPEPGVGVVDHLARFGRPITYSYVTGRYPLVDYQTVFARDPGSAEMPSAGRPFTTRIVTDLATRGVTVAPITLHTGVSSLEEGRPLAEWYRVPPATARLVEQTRAVGGPVVAIGTTVTRALESVRRSGGAISPAKGGPAGAGPGSSRTHGERTRHRLARAGCLHLLLLEAVAGPELVAAAYRAALAEGCRWHEFGDSCLLLP